MLILVFIFIKIVHEIPWESRTINIFYIIHYFTFTFLIIQNILYLHILFIMIKNNDGKEII